MLKTRTQFDTLKSKLVCTFHCFLTIHQLQRKDLGSYHSIEYISLLMYNYSIVSYLTLLHDWCISLMYNVRLVVMHLKLYRSILSRVWSDNGMKKKWNKRFLNNHNNIDTYARTSNFRRSLPNYIWLHQLLETYLAHFHNLF